MDSSSVVVCREIFDENSQPSAEEITEYAHQIGIDPQSETHLLPLAKDGLMQALPHPWKAYYDEKLDTHYYYNLDTKQTQWEHPLDKVYKDLVKKARRASEKDQSVHDDTCASVQDLLTFEENSKQTPVEKIETKVDDEDEDLSTDSSLDENISSDKYASNAKGSKSLQKPGGIFASFSKKTLTPITALHDRKLAELRSSPLRRSMDSNLTVKPATPAKPSSFTLRNQNKELRDSQFSLYNSDDTLSHTGKANIFEKPPFLKQKSEIIDLKINLSNTGDNSKSNNVQNPKLDRGISFSGGGSMFLKSKLGDNEFTSTTSDTPKSDQNLEQPKGILRDKVSETLETKIEVDKSQRFNIHRDLEIVNVEDDRKSVRFNLDDKDLDIKFDFSPSASSNSSSDQMQDKENSIITNLDTNDAFKSPATPIRTSLNKITNETLADLPPKPVKIAKLVPIVKSPAAGEIGKFPISKFKFPKDIPLPQRKWIQRDTIDADDKLESSQSSATERLDSQKNSEVLGSQINAKKLLKPPAGDFIKPNLFQKQFDKIADIIKPVTAMDSDTESYSKPRPRSPMSPHKNKISINLMESIESETSIESPDKEYALPDLNDSFAAENLKEEREDGKVNSARSDKSLTGSTNRFYKEKLFQTEVSHIKESIEKDLDTVKQDLLTEKLIQEKTLRQEMEKQLAELRASIMKENELDKQKLRSELSDAQKIYKTDIEKELVKLKEHHEMDIQQQIEALQLQLAIDKEEAINQSQDKHKVELENAIREMQEDHNHQISILRDQKKEELSRMTSKLEQQNTKSMSEMHEMLMANFKSSKTKAINDNKEEIEKMRMEHESICNELRKDYRTEVELLRSQHSCHLSQLKERLEAERRRMRDTTDEPSYEKLKNDKRLLEDKYRCLKEKYARLKNDVKMSIERRNKRREQSMTTGSETERSNSHKTAQTTDKSKDGGEVSAAVSSKSEITNANVITCTTNANNNPVIKCDNDSLHLDQRNRPVAHNNNTESGEHKKQKSNIHLTISARNGNLSDRSSEHSRSRSPNVCDKSLLSRLTSKDDGKYKNSTDNELSLGLNDTSLSQSESHTVSKGKSKLTVAFSSDVDKVCTKKDERNRGALKKAHFTNQDSHEKAATDYHDSSDTANSAENYKTKESSHGRGRKKAFTRLKSASTSRLNYSPKRGDRSCSPVENLRLQLRKLEDLEDQFPDLTLNVDTAGYRLRYPFADFTTAGLLAGSGSPAPPPELEFVAHRALVEREGVRRARAALRRRRAALRERRHHLDATDTTDGRDVWQEERDLTDLEVSLHRTRALLGEKVIRLRHIEKALRQLTTASSDDASPDKGDRSVKAGERKDKEVNKQESTLSDISSQSSGFSSTEAQTDYNIRKTLKREVADVTIYEQSTEIINSLENLNTEIRDIWQVLNVQQRYNVAKVLPPDHVLYGDFNFPIMGISGIGNNMGQQTGDVGTVNLNVQHIPTLAERLQTYQQVTTNQRQRNLAATVVTSRAPVNGGVATSLVERTKDLRDWLKQQASL